MVAGALSFKSSFFETIQREAAEADPTGFDDGVPRRWARVRSGFRRPGAVAINGQLLPGKLIVSSPSGIDVKQLIPVKEVGTGSHVTKNPDKLTRRVRRFTPVIRNADNN